MNEQWRQQLKDKMEGYQRPAPEVSWEKIDKVLDARKPRQLWLWRIAAAVAVVLAIAGAGYWMTRQEPTEQPPLTAKTTSPQEPMEPMGPVSPMSPMEPIIPISPISPKGTKQVSSGSAAQQQDTLSAMLTEAPQDSDAMTTTETATTNSDAPLLSLPRGEDMIPFIQRARGRSLKLPDNRLTAKVYYTSILSSIGHTNPELYYSNGEDGGYGLIVNFSPHDSDSIANVHTRRGPQNYNRIRYHQPVRFGISLRYQLNDNWSVESGLMYTLLVADVEGKEQRHSYIGLPINIGYQLWARRRFGIYLTAGGMIEKMLDANPWQLSLNLAIGAEYKLTDRFSLYAEPGGGYYFSNKSSIPTIYQEHPFNFNLNIGLRFYLK